MMTWIRIAGLAAVVWSVSIGSADACSCIRPGPPCEAFWQADAVFVGRVASISSDGPFAPRLVTFQDAKALRGALGTPTTVTTDANGASCGYTFHVGQTYIVYAHRLSSGALRTGICTRTAPVGQAAEDLAYAKSMSAGGAELASIDGTATLIDLRLDGPSLESRALRGVTLRVMRGGRQVATGTSDDTGKFAIRVAPGSYRLEADPGAGLYARGFRPEIELMDPRACAAVTVNVYYDGRITGRMVDEKGRPLSQLSVEAVPAADMDRVERNGQVRPRRARATATTGDDGRFVLAALPPGWYAVGVNLAESNGIGGVPRARASARVEVGRGTSHDAGDLRLPGASQH